MGKCYEGGLLGEGLKFVLIVSRFNEFISVRLLEGARDGLLRHGVKDNHREHVNEYIQENPQLFEIAVLSTPPGKNHPRLRLTVDTDEDLQRACYIVENSPQSYVTTEEAIRLCSQYV